MSYILAFDQGTTSSRSIIFDHSGNVVAVGQKEVTQIYPQSGWVEHDPHEIWNTQIETAINAVNRAGLSAADIAAVGVTNQRETAVMWDRQTGRPIYNAIVWQDRRTSGFCNEIRATFGELIRAKTGLEVDAYFSASKIRWLLDNIDGARRRAESGELAFGTIDSWLIWKLTNGRVHITDVSNASRTMLFNINELAWDDKLLEIFNIPRAILPDVRSSSEIYGEIETPGELRGIKIAGNAGDQQAALFGQTCFAKGSTKNTYGTGCFMLQNTGTSPAESKNRLLWTVAWQVGGVTEYALEGSVFIGGAVIQWLRDSLKIIDSSSDVEALTALINDNGGVYFVPAFAGLGSPHWNQEARGLIIGLTCGTGREHIARAAVESIAFQTADLLEAMHADSGANLSELRVDGGAVANNSLMQFQADILQIPVVRPKTIETTALGAAYLAGLAVGFWRSKHDLAEHWRIDKIFEPEMSADKADNLKAAWHEAVKRSLDWAV
ncbi:MAG TPA: glycerol kinase GlpK [Pyrinomonadaceae bacterium]|nr:glycerol kinase GlpK [Pyrinomonadaceae bacterium]